MKKFEEYSVTKLNLYSIQCDVCKRIFINNLDSTDYYAINDFFSIEKDCGYGSIFGDGNKISLDVCGNCTKELLGKYIKEY